MAGSLLMSGYVKITWKTTKKQAVPRMATEDSDSVAQG